MHGLLRGAVGLLACLLLLPVLTVQAQNPDAKKDEKKPADKKEMDKKDADKKEPANTDKTVKAGQLTGKVLSVNESAKSIKLQVTFEVPKLNQGEANNLQAGQRELLQAQAEAQQAQLQIAQALNQGGTPDQVRQRVQDAQNRANQATQKILQAQQKIALARAKLITTEKKTQDMDFTAAENVIVRQANPPIKFDGEGKLVKYTKKDLDELRGDPKLPGFPADFADVTQNTFVTVSLVQKQGKPVVPAKGKDKDADPAAALDILEEFQPKMSMIVILGEAQK